MKKIKTITFAISALLMISVSANAQFGGNRHMEKRGTVTPDDSYARNGNTYDRGVNEGYGRRNNAYNRNNDDDQYYRSDDRNYRRDNDDQFARGGERSGWRSGHSTDRNYRRDRGDNYGYYNNKSFGKNSRRGECSRDYNNRY